MAGLLRWTNSGPLAQGALPGWWTTHSFSLDRPHLSLLAAPSLSSISSVSSPLSLRIALRRTGGVHLLGDEEPRKVCGVASGHLCIGRGRDPWSWAPQHRPPHVFGDSVWKGPEECPL